MMEMKRPIVIVMALLLVLAGYSNSSDNQDNKKGVAGNGKKQKIQVAAVASLTDAAKKLALKFKKEHKNTDIKFSYGGSGALRRQTESGAPADILIFANTKNVDTLKGKNKTHDACKYAKNSLVLIDSKDSGYTSIGNLEGNNKLTLGRVKIVLVEKHTKQYLDNNNSFKEVESKIACAKDVKQALDYVEKGNVKQGFVRKTDLYKQDRKTDIVKVIKEVELRKSITCEAGATSDGELAKEWVKFLKLDEVKEILKECHPTA